jgi:hypothetical protein
MSNETYRGYLISCQMSRNWVAHIWPPNNPHELLPSPQATLGEGRDVVLTRARAIIDRELSDQEAISI